MALTPSEFDQTRKIQTTGSHTFTITTYAGMLPIKMDGIDIPADKYDVIGITEPTGNYYITPYININGKWRAIVRSLNAQTPSAVGTDFSVNIYYIDLS